MYKKKHPLITASNLKLRRLAQALQLLGLEGKAPLSFSLYLLMVGFLAFIILMHRTIFYIKNVAITSLILAIGLLIGILWIAATHWSSSHNEEDPNPAIAVGDISLLLDRLEKDS